MFKNITKMKTPHTYAIIFGVVIFAWILTFLIPAGRFSTHDITYTDNNGTEKTRTVLQQDSFPLLLPLQYGGCAERSDCYCQQSGKAG